MNIEHATPELFAALAKAQAEIENATKNAANPHFGSRYADLAEVLTTIRDTLPKHGLSLTQATGFDGSMAHVTTLIAHEGGGYITSVASCVPAKSDAQGIGSATTYLRRYGAAAMAGIAQEDDDGNAAAHDRAPAKSDEVAQAWIDRVQACGDLGALDALGTEVAKASLPATAKAKIRAAFAAQKSVLRDAA